jgi:hypothetical protein
MNFIDFEVGNKTYKLRLNTRSIVLLEKQLGCNPVAIFGLNPDSPEIPTVSAMVAILHASLQQYNHGISLNDAYDMFDEYLAENHTSTDFIPVILEIYKASGIMPKDIKEEQEIEEKNA